MNKGLKLMNPNLCHYFPPLKRNTDLMNKGLKQNQGARKTKKPFLEKKH